MRAFLCFGIAEDCEVFCIPKELIERVESMLDTVACAASSIAADRINVEKVNCRAILAQLAEIEADSAEDACFEALLEMDCIGEE